MNEDRKQTGSSGYAAGDGDLPTELFGDPGHGAKPQAGEKVGTAVPTLVPPLGKTSHVVGEPGSVPDPAPAPAAAAPAKMSERTTRRRQLIDARYEVLRQVRELGLHSLSEQELSLSSLILFGAWEDQEAAKGC